MTFGIITNCAHLVTNAIIQPKILTNSKKFEKKLYKNLLNKVQKV